MLEKRPYGSRRIFKAKKPKNWKPTNLDSIALYSILLGRKTKEIVGIKVVPITRRLILKLLTSRARWLMQRVFIQFLKRSLAGEFL